MLPIRKILHPTDYSDLARPAFEFACSLARDFGADLVICHVSPPPITAVDDGMVIEIPTGEAEAMAARLEEMKPADPQVRVTRRLLRGDPADEILRLAGACQADIIVMGTHGRGWLSHLLLGSVAEAVLRNAPCPVVTVKVPLPAMTPKISSCQTANVR
ncbi:MAG: universal stress protein [Planctomycetes bacterium]|nr:universal stress protein [Planctomycetota bacterium]